MTERRHFDTVAAAYDRSRPGYPAAVFDRLAGAGVLAPGCRILEIGAGSGQATTELVARGVDAIEPGPDLAALLRDRLPDVRVLTTDIETQDRRSRRRVRRGTGRDQLPLGRHSSRAAPTPCGAEAGGSAGAVLERLR